MRLTLANAADNNSLLGKSRESSRWAPSPACRCLTVSIFHEAPRQYRGQDDFYWILQLNLHGPAFGINGLQTAQLPSPAARFMCNPLISGNGGGHSIPIRDLGRRGVRLHGRFEGAYDGGLVFSDGLPERLALVEGGGARLGRLAHAFIAAARIGAGRNSGCQHGLTFSFRSQAHHQRTHGSADQPSYRSRSLPIASWALQP